MSAKAYTFLAIFASAAMMLAGTARADDHTVTAAQGIADQVVVEQGAVEVRIEGVTSTKGEVYASIFLTDEGFPGNKNAAYAYRAAPASDGTIVMVFDEVPAGEFVVAVLHDKDSNQELSFNMLGMPKEGYGFSRDARSKFGPPKFDKAAVTIEAGESKTLTVNVKG